MMVDKGMPFNTIYIKNMVCNRCIMVVVDVLRKLNIMIEVDSTIAADHIMMCAQNLGLSSCWITYFDPAIIRKDFNIPDNLVPVNILAIGYGDDKPQYPDRHERTRKPLSSIVKYTTF